MSGPRSQNDSQLAPRLVRASAGTGKTFALSNRFLALLCLGERPDRILATTFTRKAAGEIVERVFRRLALAASSPEQAARLADEIGIADLDIERVRAALATLIEYQHRLQICTLDTLFSAMAQAFSLELGVSPGWRISDPVLDRLLVAQAVQELCAVGDVAEIVDLLRDAQQGAWRRAVHTLIEREVTNLYHVYRNSDQAAWCWLTPPPGLRPAELERLRRLLNELEPPSTKRGTPRKNFVGALAKIEQRVQSELWEQMLEVPLVVRVLEGGVEFDGVPIPDAWCEVARLVGKECASRLLARLAQRTRATFELMRRFHHAFLELRSRAGTLSFDEVKERLAEAAVSGRLEELYFRLDTKFAHVLLDEFQDTSRAEWRVLEPLVAEVLSKASGEHSFLCVGDVKQAIYGWRGGVASIFDTLEARWPHLEVQSHEVSYRCSPAVLEVVNRTFLNLTENNALGRLSPAAQSWARRFAAHHSARPELPGYVTLELVPPGERNAESSQHCVAHAATLVARQLQRAPNRSIGVLTRTNRVVAQVLQALRSVGVRASDEGGAPLDDSPLVEASLVLLRLLDHPGDTVARFHLAHTPLGKLLELSDWTDGSAFARRTRMLRASLLRDGYTQFLFRLRTMLLPHGSPFDIRRMEQLAELAIEYPGSPHGRTVDFVDWARDRRVVDPSAAAVRVMTIHGAKGLEFDCVVLPDLDSDFAQEARDAVLVSYDDPLGALVRVSHNPKREVRALSRELEQMQQELLTSRVEEKFSLLYVALTRARHALHLVTSCTSASKGCSFGALLRSALGVQSDEPGVVFEHGTADWFGDAAPSAKKAEFVAPPALQPRSPGSVRIGPRLTPSSLEGHGSFNVAERFSLRGDAAATRGVLLHRFFQQLRWIEDGVPDREELRRYAYELLPRSLQDTQLFESLVQEFHQLCDHPNLRAPLSRAYYEGRGIGELTVANERPFAVREAGGLMSGKLDRLVTGRFSDGARFVEVVDFKTDRFPPTALQERSEYYRPQIEAYRRALASIFRIPFDEVRGTLVFLGLGLVVDMSKGESTEAVASRRGEQGSARKKGRARLEPSEA